MDDIDTSGFPRAKPIPDIDRVAFWARVEASGGADACWPWSGAKTAEGYGYLRIGGGSKFKAHRVALTLATRPGGAREFACHSCDNPVCCNPAHLFWGSNSDNARDMHSKGRNKPLAVLRGEHHPSRKLTEEQVREIRALSGALSQSAIARKFGIALSSAQAVINRKHWRHVQ